MGNKIPQSVLVVVHTPDLRVLLLERADHPGFWQSVTGSVERVDEPLEETCRREVLEETGIDCAQHVLSNWQRINRYEIYPQWRYRYPDGITENCEHVFGLLVPGLLPVRLAPREHLAYDWLDWEAAADRCFSVSNAEAIRMLPERLAAR
jgi:dATP pyrophosphohydrolase